MLVALKVLTLTTVAVAMSLALAHALEWPGKMRLSKAEYLAVQPIYYPGFTFGGAAEPLGLLLLILLSFLAEGGAEFWLVVGALASLGAMHAIYWLVTHPVNNFWLKGFELGGTGTRFFTFGALRSAAGPGPDWRALRDLWEFSHLVRAGLSLISFVLLATAIAI